MNKRTLAVAALILIFSFSGCQLPWSDKSDEPQLTDAELAQQEFEKMQGGKEVSVIPVEEENAEETPAEEEAAAEEETSTEATEEPAVEEPAAPAHTITVDNPVATGAAHAEPVVFNGKVSEGATKIVVTAKSEATSNPPQDAIDDTYTLQDFETGDDTFTYRAADAWGNLNYGVNDYEFTAHFEDGTTATTTLSVNFVQDGT